MSGLIVRIPEAYVGWALQKRLAWWSACFRKPIELPDVLIEAAVEVGLAEATRKAAMVQDQVDDFRRGLVALRADAEVRASAHQIGWTRVVVLNDLIAELDSSVALRAALCPKGDA